MTLRFLTKVNTYISGSKHGRFTLSNKLFLEIMNNFIYTLKKNLQFLTKVTCNQVPACENAI